MEHPHSSPEDSRNAQVEELLRLSQKENPAAREQLFRLVEEDLRLAARRLFRQERVGGTLQTTAIVNEAWLRLHANRTFQARDRNHYLATAARAMRHLLIDHARRRRAQKRGADAGQLPLNEFDAITTAPSTDVLALNEALDDLERLHPRQADVVQMKYFGGMTVPEISEELECAVRTVEADWTAARVFLKGLLLGDPDDGAGQNQKA